jgi:hypothetical protein
VLLVVGEKVFNRPVGPVKIWIVETKAQRGGGTTEAVAKILLVF